MPYIVQPEGPDDHPSVSKTYEDPKEALANAVEWAGEGRKVKIKGNAKICTQEALARAIIKTQ